MKKLILLAAISLGSIANAWADERVPEPTIAQQIEAEKVIKDVYKEEFSKRGIEERRALGIKLLEEGKNNKSDPASQYVLLRIARDAAAQVSDVDTAMEAAAEIGKVFKVDGPAIKLAALQSMKTPSIHGDVAGVAAKQSIALIAEASTANNIDVASKAADLAVTFATAAKDMAQVSEAQARRNEVKAQATAYLAMKVAEEKLKKDPKDPAANLAAGIYVAVYLNDWDRGLPLIQKGDDAGLAMVAKADLAAPVDVKEMGKIGDAWFDLAAVHAGYKTGLLNRAEFWYKLVAGNADGLLEAKVEKRLDQIAAAKGGVSESASYGTISDATRQILPTSAEIKHIKELNANAGTDYNARNELVNIFNMIEMRMRSGLVEGTEGDFFARCKAARDLRKLVTAPGVFFNGSEQGLITNFSSFASNAPTREAFANRLLAYERYNFREKVLEQMSVDSVVYAAIRNHVTSHHSLYPDGASREGLAAYLRSKGVKSAGVQRYAEYALRYH